MKLNIVIDSVDRFQLCKCTFYNYTNCDFLLMMVYALNHHKKEFIKCLK